MKKLIALLFLLIPVILCAEDKPDLSPMEAYRPLYWVFGDKEDQTKLQFSFKYALLKHYDSGIYLAYSQYAMWKFYDASSPFGDINYNPEIFIKSKYVPVMDFITISPYEHMSNGRDGADSRSLDRGYAQAQWSIGEKINAGIDGKIQWYYNQAKENKNYSRLTKNYEARLFISVGEDVAENSRSELYVKFSGLKNGYQEYGFISRKLPFLNPRLYLQVFHGTCETLLSYTESETRVRFGVIFK